MSVWRRYDNHGFPSLLTTNVQDRRPIFRSPDAAQLLVEVIKAIESEEDFRLLAYVVMPDHLHIVAWPQSRTTTGRIMKMIKGRFAKKYHIVRGEHGALWQSRYHEKALTSDDALKAAVDYVYHNPVAAGLVEDPSQYAWSTAHHPSPCQVET